MPESLDQRLADTWDAFFHAVEAQPHLEVVRIVFGVVAALYFGRRLGSVMLCLGPGGLAENLWRLRVPRFRLSPWAVLGHPRWLAPLPVLLGLLGAIGLAAGYATQLSAGLLCGAQLVLIAELSFMATGVDFVVLAISFLLACSPAGAAWSVDAWAAGVQAIPQTPVWATRLLQIQLCVVYLVCVALKYREAQWRSGRAVLFSVTALGVSRPRGLLLARWPALTRLLAWSTLALETVAPVTLWFDATYQVTLLLVVGLHLGLDLFLRLWPFQWVMVAGWLVFLRPTDLAWLP